MKRIRIGLALGGGAARALAHIGVIERLEAHGIPIDIVAGTSMGAIIGSLYAAGRDIASVRRKMDEYLASDTFRQSRYEFMREREAAEGQGIFFPFSQFAHKTYYCWMSLSRRSFASEEVARRHFELLTREGRIEDLELPFAAVALDLISGQEVVIDRGEIRPAVAATCSLPGILPPVALEGRLLVDGGWINAVPVEPAQQLGADLVLAVNVSRTMREFEDTSSGMDIVFRCDAITRYALCAERLRHADLVLEPDVHNIYWADFSRMEEAIERGREEVERNIDKIRSLVRTARIRKLFGRKSRRAGFAPPSGRI